MPQIHPSYRCRGQIDEKVATVLAKLPNEAVLEIRKGQVVIQRYIRISTSEERESLFRGRREEYRVWKKLLPELNPSWRGDLSSARGIALDAFMAEGQELFVLADLEILALALGEP